MDPYVKHYKTLRKYISKCGVIIKRAALREGTVAQAEPYKNLITLSTNEKKRSWEEVCYYVAHEMGHIISNTELSIGEEGSLCMASATQIAYLSKQIPYVTNVSRTILYQEERHAWDIALSLLDFLKIPVNDGLIEKIANTSLNIYKSIPTVEEYVKMVMEETIKIASTFLREELKKNVPICDSTK